jgi:hypothetical protein
MAHTTKTIGGKLMGRNKDWKKHDEAMAEAAHELGKRGEKQKTFFSDTGESWGKGHRIPDTARNRKRWGWERDEHKKGGKVKRKNTRRENRLEELGRVDAERAYSRKGKRNLKSEKRRIVRELKSTGGSAGSRGVATHGFGKEIR